MSPLPLPDRFCWLTCEYRSDDPVNCAIRLGRIWYDPRPTSSLCRTFACPSTVKSPVIVPPARGNFVLAVSYEDWASAVPTFA